MFKMAREDKRSTYHVFVAASLMEYYCSKVCDACSEYVCKLSVLYENDMFPSEWCKLLF